MSPINYYAHNCYKWVESTFGKASVESASNRAARVCEEAVELAQSEGVPEDQVLKIVARCYSRPVGNNKQEAAGVFFTLLVYAKLKKINLWRVVNAELTSVMKNDPEIFRAKQREKFAAGTDRITPV